MKIKTNPSVSQVEDLNKIYESLKNEHRNVFMYKYENELFFFRTLTRKEYRQLVEAEDMSNYEKEDIVCSACVLWPKDFDFDNSDAALPTLLCNKIIETSFFASEEERNKVYNFYRQDMFDLDNQISCIINEAFPNYDIEEIEDWDVEKTAKYLSRAEWKLVNLRGMNFYSNPFEIPSAESKEEKINTESSIQQPVEHQPKQETVTENKKSPIQEGKIETVEERQRRLAKEGIKKEKMTPEKLAELKRKFPEINWGQDTNFDDMKDNISTLAPALRPGW